MYWYISAFILYFFFFNVPATTEIYTLSLHDALPICSLPQVRRPRPCHVIRQSTTSYLSVVTLRSEEHTSELQSRQYLVCRLLLEKKKTTTYNKLDISIE